MGLSLKKNIYFINIKNIKKAPFLAPGICRTLIGLMSDFYRTFIGLLSGALQFIGLMWNLKKTPYKNDAVSISDYVGYNLL